MLFCIRRRCSRADASAAAAGLRDTALIKMRANPLGIAIIGGIISQLILLFVWFFTKPRLRLQIGSVVPFVLVARCAHSPTGWATWIRIRVKNWGCRDAQSCRLYLTDIIKKGERELILKKDAMRLWASAGGDGDPYAPLTISRGFSRFFDIGFIPRLPPSSSHATVKSDLDHPPQGTKFWPVDHLSLASPEFWIRHPEPLPPATYKFRTAASGNNFHPATRKIRISFKDANTVKVSSFSLPIWPRRA